MVKATPEAPKGTWNVEVESLAQKASAVTNGFPDKDKTQIGTGYFKFQYPDGEKEVYINGASSHARRCRRRCDQRRKSWGVESRGH